MSSVSTAATPSVSKLQSLQEVCKVAVSAPLSAADIFMRNKGVFSRHVSGQYWQGRQTELSNGNCLSITAFSAFYVLILLKTFLN